MSLKIAILGTRGIPASYGGFETFAEELSTRLVARGHAVTDRYESLCLRLASRKATRPLSPEPPRLPEASRADRAVEYPKISSAQ